MVDLIRESVFIGDGRLFFDILEFVLCFFVL